MPISDTVREELCTKILEHLLDSLQSLRRSRIFLWRCHRDVDEPLANASRTSTLTSYASGSGEMVEKASCFSSLA